MIRQTHTNPYESTLSADQKDDYESKGRGFESRRAHCPGIQENQGFQGFSLLFPNGKIVQISAKKSIKNCPKQLKKQLVKRKGCSFF